MKKLLSTIMALVMLLSLVPMAVAEEGAGTETGAVQSSSVYAVSDAAQLIWAAKNHTGDTIKLKGNVTLSEPVKITKSVVLDLGDYTVTYGGEGDLRAIYVENGADVQIKATANGGVVATTIALQVNPGGKLTVDGGTYNATYAVAVFSNETKTEAEAVLNSGTYDGFVYTNGTNKNSHVTFNGGTYNEMIYLAAGGQSSYEITDGLFNAALEIDAGQLDILGGTFKSSVDTTNNVNEPATNNNGSGAYQGIIVVCKPDGSSKTGYIGDAVVNIKGGTFENTFANGETIVVADFGKDEKGAGDAKVTISGDAVVKGKIALYSSENNDGVSLAISGGAFTDLASAVKYAADGATITLAGNAKGDVVIPAGKTITLDLGGKTLTNVKEHTIVNNGTLTITGTGTVDNVTHGKAALYNKGAATLNGGTFERSAEAGVDSGNNGGNSFYTILNHGVMTVNEGVVVNNKGHYSSLFENGYYSYNNLDGVEKPSLIINDGTFDGGLNTIKNDDNATLVINNGTFKNYTQACVQNHHVAEINGGEYIGNKAAAVLMCGACKTVDETHDRHVMSITDGNFKGALTVTVGKLAIKGGTFTVDPSVFVTDTNLVVVPNVGKTEYTVQPKTSEDGTVTKVEGNTKTETKTDGNTKTETKTDLVTGATTETVTTPNSTTVTKTDATGKVTQDKTETKTETKTENGVETNTTTVTKTKTEDGKTTEATETVTTVKTENGGTTTVVTEKDTLNKTETTEVTGVTAPTTASDVTLDVKNTTNVAVNKASMAALKGDNVKDVVIETKDAKLTLNKDAVKTMEGNVPTNGKMTLNVTVTENTAKEVTVTVEAKTQGDKNVFPPETKNTNGEIEITIPYTGTADYLDLWYVTNTSTYMGRFPVVNGYVSFKVTHFSQYNLIPVASSGSSVIKTGAGSSAASTTQTVTTDLTPGSITKVTVDGKVVDAKYYTVSGSNVTFTAEFLKTLKNGSHTVTVENATKIAKGVFTVNNPTTAVQAPTTADAGIALYAGMAIASVMGTGVVFTSRKRKNH